jgi:hypothetical protein
MVLPSDLAAERLSERVPVFAVHQNVAKALGCGESLAPLLSAHMLQLLDTPADKVRLRPAIVRKEAPSLPIRGGGIVRTLVGHHILPGRFAHAQQHDHEQNGKYRDVAHNSLFVILERRPFGFYALNTAFGSALDRVKFINGVRKIKFVSSEILGSLPKL